MKREFRELNEKMDPALHVCMCVRWKKPPVAAAAAAAR